MKNHKTEFKETTATGKSGGESQKIESQREGNPNDVNKLCPSLWLMHVWHPTPNPSTKDKRTAFICAASPEKEFEV